ncbi:MAG: nicotinate-nucleotide--dimethylbenzimidazole phosphoribosyltransferase [Cellulosilyticaceae bacterium]
MTKLEKLKDYIGEITLPDLKVGKEMEAYIDGLTKPVGSLGRLEEMVIQLAAVQGGRKIDIDKKVIVIMCSDNGVYEEGISECPQEVTAQVTYNFTRGITGVNQLARFAKSDIHIVDVGVNVDLHHPQIHNRKISYGTANMTKGPAMSYEQALEAIWIGIEETEKLIAKGYNVIGTGEMGIGNTTTSAAVISLLTDTSVEKSVGKGSGATSQTFEHKLAAINKAIVINNPDTKDPVDVVAKVGGYDLAGLAGVFIAAAKHQKIVVIDGVISVAAALIAYKLCEQCKAYMLASHLSQEIAMQEALKEMGIKAHFDLEMRLGEGSGCPIMFNLMEMAKYTLLGMGTFEDAGVDKEAYMNIWK